MFRIIQVLNNNVAVVHTPDNKQVVIMGRGIAFKKQKGDLINSDKVQKIFELKDNQAVSDLTTLLATIPLDFITVSYEAIDKVQQKYKFDVENYIYVTLTTHLFAAYERLQKKIKNINYLPDLSKNYPVAYQIADEILVAFKNKLEINFPGSERKSIALHFINAHTDQKSLPALYPQRNEELVQLVKNELKVNGIVREPKNDNDYDRLLIHLKYFADRLNNNQPDTLKVSKKMTDEISKEYPQAWKIVSQISNKILEKLKIHVSLTEKSYLTIHIQRLL